jgi:hypothetical protein
MHESEVVLVAELDRLAATGPSREPDWADVVRRARPANRTRRHALIAVPLVFLAIALPTVALSAGLRSALGFGSRPIPVLSRSHLLVGAPVGNGFYAQAWRAPSTTGGTCLFLTHNRSRHRLRPVLWNGGGSCSEHGGTELNVTTAQLPLAPGISIARRAKHGILRNWVPPIVFGSVYPKLHATRVVIEWNGGKHELALRGDWFLGGTPALYMPSADKLPFNVVAYDRAGHTLAHKTLDPKILSLR